MDKRDSLGGLVIYSNQMIDSVLFFRKGGVLHVFAVLWFFKERYSAIYRKSNLVCVHN